MDWNLAKLVKEQTATRPTSTNQRNISAPRRECHIINVDASFPSGQLTTGIGMCLRDETGRFQLGRTCWMHGRVLVKEGEALGLLLAMQWAQSLNIHDVRFELDAKCVVDSINSHTLDLSEFGSIISTCRRIFHSEPNFAVKFVRRQGNVVAHTLAGVATSYPSPHVFNSLPVCNLDLIEII